MSGCGCTEASVAEGCRVHDSRAVPRSPDCRDGNHGKCDGTAWDLDHDALTRCGCRCGWCGKSAAVWELLTEWVPPAAGA